MRSRSAWPVRATSGARSRKASAMAVTRFSGPGAERAQADAGAPGQAAVHVGHVGPALLVSNRDEGDRRVASDWLRSRVSSPGIPKTYLTPSASRHSTNTSLARRLRCAIACNLAPQLGSVVRAVRQGACASSSSPCRGCAAGAARDRAAPAATQLTITGAGFGHGIGMSQYGALRLRAARLRLRRHPRPLLRGHDARRASTPTRGQGAAAERREGGLVQRRPQRRRGQTLDPARPTRAPRRGGLESARRDRAERRRRSPGRCASTRPSASRCACTARRCNGVRDGLYRGSLAHQRLGLRAGASTRSASRTTCAAWSAAESPSSWPTEALKAQAVAARTLRDDHARRRRRLRPVRRHALAGLPRRLGRDAAAPTPPCGPPPGQVVTYRRRSRSTTYFFSASGGETEDVAELVRRLHAQAVAEGASTTPTTASRPSTAGARSASRARRSSASWAARARALRAHRRDPARRLAADRARRRSWARAGVRASRGPTSRRAWACPTAGRRSSTSRPCPRRRGRRWPPRSASAAGSTCAPGRRARCGARSARARPAPRSPCRPSAGGRWHAAATTKLRRGGGYAAVLPRSGTYRVRYHGLDGPPVRVTCRAAAPPGR